jgi:AAA+ ATPase superfamily predicted ATPase
MKNPYWNRTMIREPKYFFGRKKEIKQIFATIGVLHPQSISVLGERKIGKSSLLYYILQSNKREQKLTHPEKYVFAFLDFQRYMDITIKEFWKMLYSELKEKLPGRIGIKPVENYETFTDMVKILDDHGYKLILLFDEFDKILENKNFEVGFFSFLRSMAIRYDVAYIISTQKELLDLSRNDLFGSPFFNIFTPIRLGLFQEDEALDLIICPSAEEGVPLRENKEFILKNAGLFPFFIQLLCHKLYRYKKKHNLKIDKEGYMQVLEEFRKEATSHFKHFWNYLSKEEKNVLVKIAKGRKIENEKKFVVEDLKQREYLISINGKNQIFSETFRQFILDHQPEVIEVGEGQSMKQGTYKVIWYQRILEGGVNLISVIILGILSNWVYENYFSGGESTFRNLIGKILSIFPSFSKASFIAIVFLLIIFILLSLSRRKLGIYTR